MDLTDEEIYEGITVDLEFEDNKPGFGDLFTICGYENPNFPPSGKFRFNECVELQFSQVDDYFGVRTRTEIGDDIAVWLYPIIDGSPVDHHPGPFDALRIQYSVLKNPPGRAEHFYLVLKTLLDKLPLTSKTSIDDIKKKVSAVTDYWSNQGIKPGSKQALAVDY